MRTASGRICQLETILIVCPVEAHGRRGFLWTKKMGNGLETIIKPFPWGCVFDLGSVMAAKRVESVTDHLRRPQARLQSPNYIVCIFEIEVTRASGK